jgi:hypothetical protein
MTTEEINAAVEKARQKVVGNEALAILAAGILQADATNKLAAVFEKINAGVQAREAEKKLTANEQRKQWTR